MPPATGRRLLALAQSHDSRRSPRRTGVAHSALVQEQSSGRAAEGHGMGVTDAKGNAEAVESYLVRPVLLPVRLFLWAKYKYYYYLPIWGWAPWP